MIKPQGYLQLADEWLFCLFALGLPYCRSLFFGSVSSALLICLFALVLLFLAKHSKTIAQTIRYCIHELRFGVVLPQTWQSGVCLILTIRDIRNPFLKPFLNRPPPSLLVSHA